MIGNGLSFPEVAAFRDRSLAGTTYPCVLLDATYCKARVNRRVVSQAIVVAIGVTADGRREVLGMDVGDSEDGAFCTAFLRSLKTSRLACTLLVISDAHSGLKQAIAAVFIGSGWQRCRANFMRNVLAIVPKGNEEMVAAGIRTIFAQPDAEHVAEQFEAIAGMLGRQLPKAEAMLRDAKDDLLAFASFPQAHWRQVWSTNPLERVNKEIKRRTDVVGVFPNPEALLSLAGGRIPANVATLAYKGSDCSCAKTVVWVSQFRHLRGRLLSSFWTSLSRSAEWTARSVPFGK